MRITESKLRRLIRKIIKENNPLIIEALKKGFQVVDEITIINSIKTNVREFCAPSMLYDYDILGVGILCDKVYSNDFISALYRAEHERIEIPNMYAVIDKVSTEDVTKNTITVSIEGPVSEEFFNLLNKTLKEADADMNMYPGEGIVKVPTVNNGFKFSAEDTVKIINSTIVMN